MRFCVSVRVSRAAEGEWALMAVENGSRNFKQFAVRTHRAIKAAAAGSNCAFPLNAISGPAPACSRYGATETSTYIYIYI